MVKEILNGRYVDEELLQQYLRLLFEKEPITVLYRRGKWQLSLPRHLTEKERSYIEKEMSQYRKDRDENKRFYEDAGQTDDSLKDAFLATIPRVKSTPHNPNSFTVGAVSPSFSSITLLSKGENKVVEGLYGEEIESGQTSQVFNVKGFLSSVSYDGHKPSIMKFAVKRLHQSTTFKEFLAEFECLKRVQSLQHPYIVETLSVFRSEEQSSLSFVFAFPLALGNLKQLFRGDFDSKESVSMRRSWMWPQVIGLTSAVTYLHESSNTAHRDIKPSNVLVYVDEKHQTPILKLADFGLSVDLRGALTWQKGSTAAKSALPYDAPEYRSAYLARRDVLPSPESLLSNDIWKLGCLFTELAAFVVGGSKGVLDFSNSITTETIVEKIKLVSDSFGKREKNERLYFDNGEKVKPEVLQAIETLSKDCEEMAQIKHMLCAMLGESSVRPRAREICQYLMQHTNWAGKLHHDGTRLVELHEGILKQELSSFDKLRLRIERRTENPVDWSPMRPLPRPCIDGETSVEWQYGGKQLSVVLSVDETRQYKKYCVPAFRTGKPILPIARASGSGQVTVPPKSYQPPPQGAKPNAMGTGGLPGAQAGGSASSGTTGKPPVPQPQPSREVYWCIDKFFSEPKEIMRHPVHLRQAQTDDEFFIQTNQALNRARGNIMNGWFGWLSWLPNQLSWKICVGVDFKEFYIIKTGQDQVYLGDVGLPPSAQANSEIPEYEHGINPPDAIQMKLVAAQIVAGLRDPEVVRGQTEMVSMLPKKRVPPDFKKTMRTMGWGMHARMGYSVKKILWWLMFCVVFLVMSAAPWLIWVDHFDLQNAFMPGCTILAVLTICVAVAQTVG